MLPELFLNRLYWALRIMGAINRRLGTAAATRLHRATLGSVGANSRFQRGVRFAQPGVVSIGDGCYFWRGCEASAEVPDAPLIIEDGVQINQHVHLDTSGGLTLCSGVLISQEAVIYTHDHGLDPHAAPRLMPKIIGQDVWIGMRAVIMPQCRQIGRGAVIGAGAIVTRDVPAGAIVGGNPARVLGQKPLLAQVAA